MTGCVMLRESVLTPSPGASTLGAGSERGTRPNSLHPAGQVLSEPREEIPSMNLLSGFLAPPGLVGSDKILDLFMTSPFAK